MPDSAALPVDVSKWVSADTICERRVVTPTLVVSFETTLFDDADLVDRLAPILTETLSPRSLFTTTITFSPRLPGLPTAMFPIAARQTKQALGETLSEQGLQGVRSTSSERVRVGGKRGKLFEYAAEYPLAPDETTKDGGPVRLRCSVSAVLWPTDDGFRVVGSLFPTESVASAIERHGGTAATDLDVEVRPDEDRRFVLEIARELAD
ncbi:hypothetical protein VB773_15150 [Haloarculaceae archaeon H-GB2-1]|nr:hypothetical protein [Haloarculaceae archaeon H-GB1-1]MEA5387304.1 hypothetical protein [Haloarculaceae archaeon H-GB11]MEA5408770.1 hypothetical protein [Haloarculaceae archaeon H-GB2-1]